MADKYTLLYSADFLSTEHLILRVIDMIESMRNISIHC